MQTQRHVRITKVSRVMLGRIIQRFDGICAPLTAIKSPRWFGEKFIKRLFHHRQTLLTLVRLLNCHLPCTHCSHHISPKQPLAIEYFAARAKVIAG